jgi:hypothetical protein
MGKHLVTQATMPGCSPVDLIDNSKIEQGRSKCHKGVADKGRRKEEEEEVEEIRVCCTSR